MELQHTGMNPRRRPQRPVARRHTFFGTCQRVRAACVTALTPAAIGLGPGSDLRTVQV